MNEMLLTLAGKLTSQGEGEVRKPPDDVIKMLLDYGENGIVIDGVIAWVMVNKDMNADNIKKQLMEQKFNKTEILAARKALIAAAAGPELEVLYPAVSINRNSMIEGIKDIVEIIRRLSESGKMPLVLASPDQLRRCPKTGISKQAAPALDLQNKIASLETSMKDFMETSQKQMESLTKEVRKNSETKKTLEIPEIRIGTPNKKRKTSESEIQEVFSSTQGPTYAQKLVSGVHPLGRKQENFQPVTQQMMNTAIEDALRAKQSNKEKPKSKHIFRGSAQLESTETASLAADVDLVASGVARDATEKQLEDFLIAKGIKPVKVECLTKTELIVDKKVISITMKVTVRASQHKEAMNPEVWPFRVGVRHYRAPQRARPGAGDGSWASQSAQAGGRLEDGAGQMHAESGQGRRQHREFKNPSSRQQQTGPPILNTPNMFAGLEEQPAP